MSKERQKASKILEELIDYFFRQKANRLTMSLDYEKDQTRVHVEGMCENKPEDFQEFEELMNAPRRPELEGYYYELLGSSSSHGELKLLGSLIDRAQMSYEDQKLSITVYRDKNK